MERFLLAVRVEADSLKNIKYASSPHNNHGRREFTLQSIKLLWEKARHGHQTAARRLCTLNCEN